MRNRILIILICLLSLSCNNKQKSQDSIASVTETQIDNNTPKEIITDFYRQYIALQDSPPSAENRTSIGSILKKYLTKELISQIEKASLDYDPLINAQDVSLSWLKTLKVKEIDSFRKEYSVCYLNAYNNSIKCINLKVNKVDSTYKISDILDDNISSSVKIISGNNYKDGIYSFHVEPTGDLRTAISYYIEMQYDSEIIFKRESYSNTFNYKCSKIKTDNSIKLFHKTTIEGEDPDSNKPLITIFKKDAKYYAISPLIEDGKEVELAEE